MTAQWKCGEMKRNWIWAKRAAVAASVLAVLATVIIAPSWKRLLIAWHWNEYQTAVKTAPRAVLSGFEVTLDLTNSRRSAPLLYEYSHRILGFPADGYFLPDVCARADYHWQELQVFGYVERREFSVGEWAARGRFKAPADYPFRSEPLSPFEEAGGWMRSTRGAHYNLDVSSLEPGAPRLIVRDLKERMPLWQTFVARHNAEEAAAREAVNGK
jgi:hypothetical protein